MEIERKFLVKDINSLDLSKYHHKTIVQDYLYVDRFTAIRKRKITDNNNSLEFQAMNVYYPVMKLTKEELKKKNFQIIGKVIKVENKSAFK